MNPEITPQPPQAGQPSGLSGIAGSPSDTDRLNWLEERHVTLYPLKELWDEEMTIWWQVVCGKKSLSGHPLPGVRDAIDAAMEKDSKS